MAKSNEYIPTESEEQIALFQWAALQHGRYPELAMLHHIPNGGKRSMSEAVRFRAEGVKAGVPDLCLPVPRKGCHGLYIELKRRKGSRTSDEQLSWLQQLSRQGYQVAVCYGWEEAKGVIEGYLEDGKSDI